MAQSQSPPPAVWSGKPRKLDTDPSCITRKALHPAGTPVGAITNDRPNRSVLMLGSAALSLCCNSRFALNVATGGAGAGAPAENSPSPSITTPLPGLATTTLTAPIRADEKEPT